MGTSQASRMTRIGRCLVIIGLVVALGSTLAMVGAALGSRAGFWHFRAGFTVLRWAFWFALAGGTASLLGVVLSAGKPRMILAAGIVGLTFGAVTAYVPWNLKHTAESLPMIHDITTDTQNPPEFVATGKLRRPDDHTVAYDGPEVAAMQQKAYPDIAPLVLNAPKEKVFEAAKAAVASTGMQLVDADAAQGRIEANQTSMLWGFTDDVVVRIVADGNATRVDVRSKSRVGRSDLGQNAKRIRTYLANLRNSVG
jgi:uncharacterized protein (DUF1499 family)